MEDILSKVNSFQVICFSRLLPKMIQFNTLASIAHDVEVWSGRLERSSHNYVVHITANVLVLYIQFNFGQCFRFSIRQDLGSTILNVMHETSSRLLVQCWKTPLLIKDICRHTLSCGAHCSHNNQREYKNIRRRPFVSLHPTTKNE